MVGIVAVDVAVWNSSFSFVHALSSAIMTSDTRSSRWLFRHIPYASNKFSFPSGKFRNSRGEALWASWSFLHTVIINGNLLSLSVAILSNSKPSVQLLRNIYLLSAIRFWDTFNFVRLSYHLTKLG